MKRIQIASTGKRILAAIIDLGLAVGLGCLFYFCVFYKAVSAVQNFPAINETIKTEQIASNLYIEDNGKVITIIQKNPSISWKDLEKDHIKPFYVSYLKKLDDKYTDYWYNVHILFLNDKDEKYKGETINRPEEIIYEWNGDNAQPKNGISNEKLLEFHKASFGTATVNFYSLGPAGALVKKISLGKLRSTIYSSLIATIIPYLIVPLITKNHKTVGKLCFGLIVLTDEGYYYKRWKDIIRYLAFYIVEIFGGVITIGLTLILTSCLALFTAKKRALHDYIAFSVVVDEKFTVFFKDEDEENKYKEKMKNIEKEKLLQKVSN